MDFYDGITSNLETASEPRIPQLKFPSLQSKHDTTHPAFTQPGRCQTPRWAEGPVFIMYRNVTKQCRSYTPSVFFGCGWVNICMRTSTATGTETFTRVWSPTARRGLSYLRQQSQSRHDGVSTSFSIEGWDATKIAQGKTERVASMSRSEGWKTSHPITQAPN